MNQEKLFTIRFRYVPPELYMTPSYLIPNEVMGIRAANKEDARKKFNSGVGDDSGWFWIDSIEEG